MHHIHVAAMRRSLTSGFSRRGLLASLIATVTAVNAGDLAAKRKGKRKGKRKKRNKQDRPQDIPQTRADAQCALQDGSGVPSVPNGRIAQAFTAIQSGDLVRADLELSDSIGLLGDYILHLAPVDAFGFPTNAVLASASLPGEQVPNGVISVATFTFVQPAKVVAGTQYALVLSRPEVGIEAWVGRNDNACTGRTFTSDGLASPFVGFAQNIDLIFATFVRS